MKVWGPKLHVGDRRVGGHRGADSFLIGGAYETDRAWVCRLNVHTLFIALVLTLKCLKCSYVLTPLSGTVCTALSWTCLDCLDMSGFIPQSQVSALRPRAPRRLL